MRRARRARPPGRTQSARLLGQVAQRADLRACNPDDSSTHGLRGAGAPSTDVQRCPPGRRDLGFSADPCPPAVLLVAGDKAGQWRQWYEVNIPLAERRYQRWLDGEYTMERT